MNQSLCFPKVSLPVDVINCIVIELLWLASQEVTLAPLALYKATLAIGKLL